MTDLKRLQEAMSSGNIPAIAAQLFGHLETSAATKPLPSLQQVRGLFSRTGPKLQVNLQMLQEDPNEPNDPEHLCTEIVAFGYPDHAVECGRASIGDCAYCGDGVCVRHSDTCLEGCVLHTGCILDHEKETGHAIEPEGASEVSRA
jgi:hypothetical protein